MQFYSDGSGCLVLIIILIFIMMIFGFLARIIFTTPLGIILLIFLLVRYLLKSNNDNSNQVNNDKDTNFKKQSSDAKGANESISRDAEDVEYQEIDKN